MVATAMARTRSTGSSVLAQPSPVGEPARPASQAAEARLWRGGAVPLNTLLMSLRTLAIFVVGFLMLPLLIDRIGAAPTGLFVFATTLTGYFAAVELGIATSVTKYLAEFRVGGEQERINSMVRGSLLLMIAIGMLVAAALVALGLAGGRALFGSPSVRGQVVTTMLVAAGTALAYWPSRVGTAMLEGLERYDQRAMVGIVMSLLTLGGLWGLTFATHSVPVLTGYFGSMLVLEGAVCAAVAWRRVGLRRHLGSWRGRELRPVFAFGGGLFIIGIADTAIYSLDRLIVAAFVGATAIVVYEVALRPHNAVRMINALTAGALVSTVSRLATSGQVDRLRRLVVVGSFLGLIITLPWVILVLLLAKPLIVAWVGHAYGRFAVYAQIFVLYWLTGANTGVLGALVTGMSNIRIFVILTVIGGVTSLGLSIGMTAAFGTVGVIWGTVIPSMVGFPLWMHFALRRAGLTWREYAREVAAPAYGLLVPWAGLVWAGSALVHPSGLVDVGLYGGLALAVWGAMVATPARRHWRAALAG
jgi:O-antigen/teichoic acid export membrane protein